MLETVHQTRRAHTKQELSIIGVILLLLGSGIFIETLKVRWGLHSFVYMSFGENNEKNERLSEAVNS